MRRVGVAASRPAKVARIADTPSARLRSWFTNVAAGSYNPTSESRSPAFTYSPNSRSTSSGVVGAMRGSLLGDF
jgi:hypothetical protein